MRKTHLVGAWPGLFDAKAMQDALERLGPHLMTLSDGETGNRKAWAFASTDALRGNPDVELVKDGSYGWVAEDPLGDLPLFRVRAGRQLDPDHIQLMYSTAFGQSYPQFRTLRERFGYPDIRFQVGLHNPDDLVGSAFGFGTAADPNLAEAFTRATLREIDAISAIGGDDVVFQIETVVSLVAVVRAAPEHRSAVAEKMAQRIVEVAARAPEGLTFGVHLCLGDFHHQAFAIIEDMLPMVLLSNAVASAWPSERSLGYIHFPFAAAGTPPSLDNRVYAPLAELDLPAGARFAAGFIHESLDLASHRRLLELIETHAQRQVDPSAACGLARRPDDAQAWDAMDKARELIETAAP